MPPFQVPFDSGDVQFTRLVFDGLRESWPGTWDQTDRADESDAESSTDTRQPLLIRLQSKGRSSKDESSTFWRTSSGKDSSPTFRKARVFACRLAESSG